MDRPLPLPEDSNVDLIDEDAEEQDLDPTPAHARTLNIPVRPVLPLTVDEILMPIRH